MTDNECGISPEDRKAILALCPKLYASVEWEAEKAPDWNAFRSCCHVAAILTPLSGGMAQPMAIETFIAGMDEQRNSGALNALCEVELASEVEAFGNVANVRSSFVATMDGVARRGVTFAHIVRDNGQWVILSAIWDNEDEERIVPEMML